MLQTVDLHEWIYYGSKNCVKSPFTRTAAHIFVSPGDAPAIITQYVAWMERQFNACQTPQRCNHAALRYLCCCCSHVLRLSRISFVLYPNHCCMVISMSGSGSRVCEILGDLRSSLPTSLKRCIYMSRGLANELLVTWPVLVTPDLCSAQELVLCRHNRFSVMHI